MCHLCTATQWVNHSCQIGISKICMSSIITPLRSKNFVNLHILFWYRHPSNGTQMLEIFFQSCSVCWVMCQKTSMKSSFCNSLVKRPSPRFIFWLFFHLQINIKPFICVTMITKIINISILSFLVAKTYNNSNL
jgi:hypothetical protein